MSCSWWFWKILTLEIAGDPDQVNDFLDSQPWGMYERNPLTTYSGKLEAYVISLYITTMTLTTVVRSV